MNSWLVKAFVKNYENTNSPQVRSRYGELSGMVGIVTNLFICTGKFVVGLLFSSISIVADAVNNLTDAASSLVTVVGFKISGRPADKEHPFGHARMEYITALIVSFIILFLGLQLVKSSFVKILNPEPVKFSLLTIGVLIVSIAIKIWMCSFYLKISKTINSTAIKATATDSFNDSIATTAVLISLLISHFTSWQLDGYIGVLVACLVIWTGIGIFRETFDLLIGEAPDEEMISQIETIVLREEKVLGIHDLIIHNYGPSHWFASVHAEVCSSDDIMKCHDAIDNLEREVMEEVNVQLTIHMDPIETENETVNELRAFVKQVVLSVDERLSMHDFRVVMGETHSNLIFDVKVPIGFAMPEPEIVRAIEEKIKQRDDSWNVVIRMDSSYTTIDFGETKE